MELQATFKLDEAIDRLLEAMGRADCRSDEYATMVELLSKLYENKKVQDEVLLKEHELDQKRRVSADTILIVTANIVGILLILGYERTGIVTTKALGFVKKLF